MSANFPGAIHSTRALAKPLPPETTRPRATANSKTADVMCAPHRAWPSPARPPARPTTSSDRLAGPAFARRPQASSLRRHGTLCVGRSTPAGTRYSQSEPRSLDAVERNGGVEQREFNPRPADQLALAAALEKMKDAEGEDLLEAGSSLFHLTFNGLRQCPSARRVVNVRKSLSRVFGWGTSGLGVLLLVLTAPAAAVEKANFGEHETESRARALATLQRLSQRWTDFGILRDETVESDGQAQSTVRSGYAAARARGPRCCHCHKPLRRPSAGTTRTAPTRASPPSSSTCRACAARRRRSRWSTCCSRRR